MDKNFAVGALVTWVSSGIRKEGFVLHVLAPGALPSEFGDFPSIESASPRDHETYIVAAKKGSETGKRKATNYWPRTSLLQPLEKLSVNLWGVARPTLTSGSEMTSAEFDQGQPVKWVSSYTPKKGTIVKIVPAGTLPHEIDPAYSCVESSGGQSLPRDHQSYVVLGYRTDGKGKEKLYWPRTALLRSA
ncbi:hypothetical protein [Acetobacter persici]|uniref:Uncharacterized protein n=1 Tax=Acetobacter persici TaxID=1076596 RepID=A0A1U9LJL3_9PROT|nr:hypothetical protein [Acetobacter persici]AQT06539.1 hypothetical protein A0U91_16155 [Acetobacter persici]